MCFYSNNKKKSETEQRKNQSFPLLQYLSDEISLKNGYHLINIFTETCFVQGNQTLQDAFETGLKLYKAPQTHDKLPDQIKERVEDDLNNFATRTKLVNLKPNNNFNVK